MQRRAIPAQRPCLLKVPHQSNPTISALQIKQWMFMQGQLIVPCEPTTYITSFSNTPRNNSDQVKVILKTEVGAVLIHVGDLFKASVPQQKLARHLSTWSADLLIFVPVGGSWVLGMCSFFMFC